MAIEIELAGTNVPVKILKKIITGELLTEEDKKAVTPEVISAAYARISRSEKNVDELIDESIGDTENARRSVTKILGMGHQSIADHATFNLNIKGVSRLLVESIEKRRLAGYTEKSQRYVTLQGDYIRPKEFSQEDLKKFEELVAAQNEFYSKKNPILVEHLNKKFPDGDKKLLEGSAKEDARFSLGLATEVQLGCSYTGQTAELAIRELRHGRLEEEREFSRLLYDEIVKVAPSLIQLSDPELFKKFNEGKELKEDNFKFTRSNLERIVKNTLDRYSASIETSKKNGLYGAYQVAHGGFSDGEINLISHNKPDSQVISALLHNHSDKSLFECVFAYHRQTLEEDIEFVKETLKHVSEFDKVPREFETGVITYEFPISASGFAQLKRHRMDTLLPQDYNPELGCTVPENIKEIGAGDDLLDVCSRSSALYHEFLPKYGKAAEYCLTNANRRRVIVTMNMRELYHFSRTREDKHAQWEIRNIANRMSRLAKQVAPATSILLGGKHEFDEIRKEVYKN